MKTIYHFTKKTKFSFIAMMAIAIIAISTLIPTIGKGETNTSSQTTDNVTYEAVVSYLNSHGFIVYWVQPVPGTSYLKAGVNNGKTVIVYTNENCILGHLDSGNN